MEMKVVDVPEALREATDRRAQRYTELVERIMSLKPTHNITHPGLVVPRSEWGTRGSRSIYMALRRLFKRHRVDAQFNIGKREITVWKR